VYPEEIEVILNKLPYVKESLIVQKKETFGALIVLDPSTETFDAEQIKSILDQNLEMLNNQIPSYSKVTWYKVEKEEFEKTPKGTIKRFIYQDRESQN